MAKLKNIILDLGGVLLNIDYNKTLQAFKDLGYNDFEEMYNQYSADALFEQLETGNITNDEFYNKILKGREESVSKDQVTRAWNTLLLDFRLSTIEFLKELAKKYNLYLLSNTNAIHLEAFRKIFAEQTGYPDIDVFFKTAYYSNLVHLRKPNRNIFQFVLSDARIWPEETLFIDDSYNNIDTARNMGFKTHLLLPGEKIEDLTYN